MARSLKQSKAHAEVLCRRLVFHRAVHVWSIPQLVASEARCEHLERNDVDSRCLAPATDWAHIIPRRYSLTRCRIDNAWALCRFHHNLVDRDPVEKTDLIRRTIGLERFYELRKLAYGGLAAINKSPLMFWRDEEEHLVEMCRRAGLPITHRG